jgi:hypothetical protein
MCITSFYNKKEKKRIKEKKRNGKRERKIIIVKERV